MRPPVVHWMKELARRSPDVVGSPWTFLGSVALLVGWLACGPFFGFSGNWLLIPATATSLLVAGCLVGGAGALLGWRRAARVAVQVAAAEEETAESLESEQQELERET